MVVTNEPGIYRTGMHGIRIENIMLVVESECSEFGTFYAIEQLTLCPIDLKPLKVEMLTEEERLYLNQYHQNVYQKLSPFMKGEEEVWLRESTRAV